MKWGEEVANYFSVSNGVRQGGVSSGIFFAIYIDGLFDLLRKSGLGCKINGVFYGAVIYADDIFLLSASRSGLQVMIDICQKYADRLNLKFGTNPNPEKSKTKCLMFTKSRKVDDNVKEIQLDGHALPWVRQVSHLGHTLQVDNSMKIDVNLKRGAFIGKVNSLLQEFYYASPSVLIKLASAYCCNIYGSNVWDLFSSDCQRLFRSYNVALRMIFNLPRTTHRYLVESLTDIPHLYVQLLSRYVTFSTSLLESDSFEVRFLARICISDMRTTLGRTMRTIASLCNSSSKESPICAAMVKKKIRYEEIKASEEWRIGVLQDMLDIRDNVSSSCGLSNDDVSEILEYICTT